MGRVVLAVAFLVAACGTPATDGSAETTVGLPSPTSFEAPSVTEATVRDTTTTTITTSTSSIDDGSVTVAVSGWVHADKRGTVLCPGSAWDGCPGIPLDGNVELPRLGETVEVTGSYDGVSLTVEEVGDWTPYERGDLVNPCTGETERGNLPPSLESKVYDIIRGHEDRVAGFWLAGGQAVVGLTGPDDELAEELRAADDRICVDTGYSMSQVERSDLASEITVRVMFDEGVWILDSWDSAVDGPLRMRVEAIDTETMQAIAEQYGDILELTAYIEVLDAPLSALPEQQPPVPADVDIPTSGTRGGVSMAALASGVVLEFDADARCLYMGPEEMVGRTVIVWPFGYSAVSGDPTIVYDPAGNEVARTGVPIDLGGGGAGLEVVDPDLRCGADSVWQMAGPTERERDVIWPDYLENGGD